MRVVLPAQEGPTNAVFLPHTIASEIEERTGLLEWYQYVTLSKMISHHAFEHISPSVKC